MSRTGVALIFFNAGVVLEHCVIGPGMINGAMGWAVIGRMGVAKIGV